MWKTLQASYGHDCYKNMNNKNEVLESMYVHINERNEKILKLILEWNIVNSSKENWRYIISR